MVLDQGLWLFPKKWHPYGGYFHDKIYDINENSKLDEILLLKLHGSINFKEEEKNPSNYHIKILPEYFYNIPINICKRETPSYVLLMSYIKKFNSKIYDLWDKAIEDLKESNKLVIIGCSFRDEDTFLSFAIRHFGEQCEGPRQIHIVDTNESIYSVMEDKLKNLVAYPKEIVFSRYKSLENFIEKESSTNEYF